MNKKKTEKRNPFSISITKTGLELLRNLANKKNTSIGKLIEMLAEEKARKLKIESRWTHCMFYLFYFYYYYFSITEKQLR